MTKVACIQDSTSIDDEGWLTGVTQVLSPNYDERPLLCTPNLLVIHNISLPPGEYGGPWIDDLFCNRLDSSAHPYFSEIASLAVSSHVLICRDGQIRQYVSFNKRAWHAGKSCFEGIEACNDYSIGIELEGCDDQPYESSQYQVLGKLTKILLNHYPDITQDRIVGHSDIAPTRKTDPGPAFDWYRYRVMLTSNE